MYNRNGYPICHQRSYAELSEIYEELEEAEAIFRRLGCPVIEVSTLAIEETAYRIIRLVETRLAEAQERPRGKRQAGGEGAEPPASRPSRCTGGRSGCSSWPWRSSSSTSS